MRLLFSVLFTLSLLLFSVANADEISHRAAAEELLRLQKKDQMMKPIFDQMSSMMEQQYSSMGVPEEERPKLKKYTDKLFNAMEEQFAWEKVKDDFITIYTETFSEDELRAISAFYKTPAGQTYIQKMPTLLKHSVELSQKKMPEMMKRLKEITAEMIQEIQADISKKSDKEDKNTTSNGI